MKTPLQIGIVDDVELSLEGSAALLERHSPQVTIARRQLGAGSLGPVDVALVDAFGTPRAGLERCKEIIGQGEAGVVVLHTWRMTPALAVEAVALGVGGVLSKTLRSDELVEALGRIVEGEVVVSEFPFHVGSSPVPDKHRSGLTERELELLSLVAAGLTNSEIGQAMYLAESSVKTYLKRVYRKLEINSRSQAVMVAVEMGLAGPDAGPNVGS